MTTMISEVYDALRDASGVSDEKARKAAEAVAQYDNRFNRLEMAFQQLNANFEKLKVEFEKLKVEFEKLKGDFEKLRVDFEKFKGEVAILKWMSGVQTAIGITILLKLFLH